MPEMSFLMCAIDVAGFEALLSGVCWWLRYGWADVYNTSFVILTTSFKKRGFFYVLAICRPGTNDWAKFLNLILARH